MKGDSYKREGPGVSWMDGVLVAFCLKCGDHPGSQYDDGSGVCPACCGSGYKVLATKDGRTAANPASPKDPLGELLVAVEAYVEWIEAGARILGKRDDGDAKFNELRGTAQRIRESQPAPQPRSEEAE